MNAPTPTRAAAAFLVSVIAVLAIAASAGAGGNVVFKGAVDQAPVAGLPAKPAIELYVYPGSRGHSGASAAITHVNIYDVVLSCENGAHVGAGEGHGAISTVQLTPYHPLLVKGGSFKLPAEEAATEGTVVSIKGTLPKQGAATGTLSVKETLGDIPGEPGEPTEHLGTCRSGTLSWTATRG